MGVLQMTSHTYRYFVISHRANNLFLCFSDGPKYRYGDYTMESVTFPAKSVLCSVFQFFMLDCLDCLRQTDRQTERPVTVFFLGLFCSF